MQFYKWQIYCASGDLLGNEEDVVELYLCRCCLHGSHAVTSDLGMFCQQQFVEQS